MVHSRSINIILVCLLSLAVIWGAVFYHAAYDRRLAFAAAEVSSANLALAFEEHVKRTAQNVDGLLLQLRDEYQRNPLGLNDRIRFLAQHKSVADLLIQVSIIDKQGMMSFNTKGLPVVPLDLSDREHFRVHLTALDDQIFISKPVLGRASKKWSIQFTRKIVDTAGAFAGVIVLSIDPDYFSNFYQGIDIGAGGVITLVGMDGVIRARASKTLTTTEARGLTLPRDRPFFDPARPAVGLFAVASAVDGVVRIGAYRRLQEYPLVVSIMQAEDDILFASKVRSKLPIGAAFLLSALTLLFGWISWRIALRRIESRKTLSQRNEQLQATEEMLRVQIDEYEVVQAQLLGAKAAAEAASTAKSEFLANMSHEIRTPMNGVIGMTGLLLDTALDEKQRRYTETVRNSGELLLGLINDILDFSKIEAGKLDLETLDFDLASLLDDFAVTLALRAQEKGLELIYAADLDVPVLLRGDPGRLRQILTNLTGNAIKFTHSGEVAIRVSLLEAQDKEMLLRFAVRDTGIGIAADKIGLLFDKFSQVDASTTREYGGSGLGLAISKQLAQLMGGEIGIDSEEGRGSEFWFTARFAQQEQAVPAAALPPADLSGVRILIVDDNLTNREILTVRLTSWGMRPTETADGPGALTLLAQAFDEHDPFRFALIDMQMPGMDGETLGRLIKTDPRLTDTLMVMLTSVGARGDARRFAEIGFAAYATKPIQHQELRDLLVLALSARDGAGLTPPSILTRHLARETQQDRFAHCQVRILLVEDNLTNRLVAVGLLQKLGLSADAVVNGVEAVAVLETIPYDLVLMDCQMPVMDGYQATACIRDPQGRCLNHAVPIVALTANVMAGDREKCLRAGMDDYLAKPISVQQLVEVLEKWLPGATEPIKLPRPAAPDAVVAAVKDPVFDVAGMMVRLMEDKKLAHIICQGHLEDLPNKIVELRECLAAGNVAQAERVVHNIKGAAANMGGEALRALAQEMEQAARSGVLGAVRARMPELEAQTSLLLEAVAQYLQRA